MGVWRKDTLATLGTADGESTTPLVDSKGQTWVRLGTAAAGSQEDGHSATLGLTTDAAAASDAAESTTARTGIGLLKGIKNILLLIKTALNGGLPAALGAGNGLKVDGSGVALPVSGTVAITNANLDIALSALRDAITGAGAAAKTLANLVTLLNGGLPTALGASGGLKVDILSGGSVPETYLGSPERLTMAGAAQSATLPANTTKILLIAEGGDIRFAINATATSTSPGYVPAGAGIWLRLAAITSFSVYGASGAFANLTYFS